MGHVLAGILSVYMWMHDWTWVFLYIPSTLWSLGVYIVREENKGNQIYDLKDHLRPLKAYLIDIYLIILIYFY